MSPSPGPPGFLDELKRRKTVRAALIYLAAAWAVLEAAGLLLPTFGAPEWALRSLIIIVAVGLLVTVVLAWAFDFTAGGIRRTAPAGRVEAGEGGADEASRVPWLSVRTAGTVLVLVTLSLSIGLWLGGSDSKDGTLPEIASGNLSEDLIAVIPFAVRGSPDLDYLGEGIVDLVSAKLDGAGTLLTVDPRLVISRVNAEGVAPDDPVGARRVAEALGAGRFITGNVLEISGRITITAYMNQTRSRGETSLERGVRAGDADQLFELLDSLVVDLLTSSMSDNMDRLQRLATLTTSSLPAAKEYLQGEAHYRQGRYRDAAEAYDRAVALDSTFSLAYYRKSIAADWIDAYDVRSSADRALEMAGGLAPRERNLLEALRLRRRGESNAAGRAFRTLAHNHPTDLEVLTQYAELIFHDTSRRGGSLREAVPLFLRMTQLEPRNLAAQVHLGRLYALYDSVGALRGVADYFAQAAPEGERALEVESLYAHMAGDTIRQAAVKERLRDKEWFYAFYAAHGVARFARDPHGALDILNAHPGDDDYLKALTPGLLVAQGKHTAARDHLERLSNQDGAFWIILEAFVLTSGTLPAAPAHLALLERKLAAAEQETLHLSSWPPTYEDLSPAFSELERDYFRTLILIDLGKLDEASLLVERISSQPDFPWLGAIKADAETSLRAEMALARGSRQEALALLRTMKYEVPHAATVHPLSDLPRSRFLRAALERERGDREVARQFYVGLDESWSPWDSYYRPLLYRALGEMAEEDADVEEAIRYYHHLLDQWRDPDPGLAEARDEIKERLARLDGVASVDSADPR